MEGDLSIMGVVVRKWAEQLVPGDRAAADRAVDAARDAVVGGASIEEACDASRRLLSAWSSHPARPDTAGSRLPAAS